jgi:hypothetical protein
MGERKAFTRRSEALCSVLKASNIYQVAMRSWSDWNRKAMLGGIKSLALNVRAPGVSRPHSNA